MESPNNLNPSDRRKRHERLNKQLNIYKKAHSVLDKYLVTHGKVKLIPLGTILAKSGISLRRDLRLLYDILVIEENNITTMEGVLEELRKIIEKLKTEI